MNATAVAPPRARQVGGRSSAIAAWTLASRLSGFIRGAVVAAVLGPTFFGNLFQSLNSLPNLLYELTIGSLLVSLLVPPLVGLIDADSPADAERLANAVLGLLAVVFVVVVAVIALARTPLLRLLTLGIEQPALADRRGSIGLVLLLLLLPQALFYASVGVSQAVQNAHGRFVLPAAAPVFENLGTIAVFAVYAARYGVGGEMDHIPPAQAAFLGIGATASVGLHAAVQWLGAARSGVRLRPARGWRRPEVREVIHLAAPSLGFAGLNAYRYLVVMVVAGTVRGGVVAYFLALSFFNLAPALVARPLATAALPELSRSLARGDERAFGILYHATLRIALFLLVPAALFLTVLARPIADSLTFGEMSSSEGRRLLVATMVLSLGVVGEGASLLATSASYARRDARSPFRGALVRSVILTAGALVALPSDGPRSLLTLGVASAFADTAAGWFIHRRVAGRVGGDAAVSAAWLPRIVTAGIAASLAAFTVSRVLRDPDGPLLRHVLGLAIAAVVFVGVYAAVAWRTRVFADLGHRELFGRAEPSVVAR